MKRPGRGVTKARSKALAFSPGVSWEWGLPGTKFDYNNEVKDGLKSSVVVAALNWVMRAFPEASAVVERREDEQWRQVLDHKLTALLRKPNEFYGGRVLWMATAMDFCFGEAFWLKIRNGNGEVVELWWVPRALIRPVWDERKPDVFITHYEYNAGGRKQDIPIKDIVHFRFGMDPTNVRRGFSQLAAVFREVYVDDQASNFTASILRNLGIIGLVFSPAANAPAIAPAKLEEFKKYIQTNFTGDKRGNALAFASAMDAKVLAYNLQGLDVGPIRDIAEERVCAALGIPAAVIGFGTGLQQTKVGATMREMIQLAWTAGIIPNQAIMADELDRSLLPDFQSNSTLFRMVFDTSNVRAFTEDRTQKHDRVRKDVTSRILRLDEARRELGYTVDKKHEVWLQPSNVIVTDDKGTVIGPGPGAPAAPDDPEPKPKPQDGGPDAGGE